MQIQRVQIQQIQIKRVQIQYVVQPTSHSRAYSDPKCTRVLKKVSSTASTGRVLEYTSTLYSSTHNTRCKHGRRLHKRVAGLCPTKTCLSGNKKKYWIVHPQIKRQRGHDSVALAVC